MPTANVSSELIWGCVKDNSAFLVKRRQTGRTTCTGKNGAQLTSEPGNVTGINSFKFSGLANAKTVSIAPASAGGVTLTTKSRKSARLQKVPRAPGCRVGCGVCLPCSAG